MPVLKGMCPDIYKAERFCAVSHCGLKRDLFITMF
jgi:hypothetical protein